MAEILESIRRGPAGRRPNGVVHGRASDVVQKGTPVITAKPEERGHKQRRAPAVARRSRDRFRALIESSEDTIVLLDAGGTIQWASPSISREIDYSLEDEFLGHGAFDFIHPEDQPGLTAAFTSLLREPATTLTGEFRARRKDGSWRWIEASAKNLLDDPRLLAIVCNYRDITDRKIAEKALRQNEQRFRALIENAADVILVLEPNGAIRYMSPSIERISGFSPEEIVSSTIFHLVHPDDISRITGSIAKAVQNPGVPQSAQFRVRHKNGEWRYLEGTGRAMVDESGSPFGIINVRDVTDRVEAAEALRRLTAELEQRVTDRTAELEQINHELESFAFSVSHDLRTQLRAMRGYGHAVLEDYGEEMIPAARDFTSRVVETTSQMDGLIQSILDYSRLTRADVQLKPLALALVVPEALSQLSSEIEERNARVSVDPATLTVLGHYQTLVQALANLVSNAIKFVAAGTQPIIKIRSEAHAGHVRIWVEDNGIGIPQAQHERIFDMFERLHGVEDYPGTGIGLAIVRRAVGRMGGRVGLESKVGQGSCFWIELPSPPDSAEQDPNPRIRQVGNAGDQR